MQYGTEDWKLSYVVKDILSWNMTSPIYRDLSGVMNKYSITFLLSKVWIYDTVCERKDVVCISLSIEVNPGYGDNRVASTKLLILTWLSALFNQRGLPYFTSINIETMRQIDNRRHILKNDNNVIKITQDYYFQVHAKFKTN